MLRVAALALLGALPGLAGCASSAWVSLRPEKVAELKQSSPPRDDATFVPGWRIGQIYLGMSRAELLAALGEPQKSSSYGEATEHYFWEPDRWFVRIFEGRVVSVQAYARGYSLSAPVTFGTSALAIRVKLGDPPCVDRDISGLDTMLYTETGVSLQVAVNGGLQAVYVVAPGELKCP